MSPFRALILPLLALAAGLARWLIQGSGNVYTDADKRFYVPDPDLGWRLRADGPTWLGLEALGVIAGVAVGVLAAAWLIRRLERRRTAPIRWMRIGLWAVAAMPLVIPAWAFASGGKPSGGVDRLPRGVVEAPASGIEGGLPGLAVGRYAVVAHEGSAITAKLSAGGEAFDARFATGIEGWWRGDPGDLAQPMTAEVSVATSAVDTGVDLRSQHAREEYLRGAEFPRIAFALTRLIAAGPEAAGAGAGVAFRGEGLVTLMGNPHVVALTGTLRAPDEAARARLGLADGAAVLLIKASFELRLHETALAKDAGDFDGDVIPIDVSLVLRSEPAAASSP
jgi:hypothetical protein